MSRYIIVVKGGKFYIGRDRPLTRSLSEALVIYGRTNLEWFMMKLPILFKLGVLKAMEFTF